MASDFQLHPNAAHLNLHPVVLPLPLQQNHPRLFPALGLDRHFNRHVVLVRVGGKPQHKVALHIGLAQIEPRRFPQAFHRGAQIAAALRVAVAQHFVWLVRLREVHRPADGKEVLDAHALSNHERPALRVVFEHRVVFAQNVALAFLDAHRQIVDVVAYAGSRRAVHPLHAHPHRFIQRVPAEQPQRVSVVQADSVLRQVQHARPVRADAPLFDGSIRAVGLRDREAARVGAANFEDRLLLHRQQIPAEGFQRDKLVAVPCRLVNHAAAQLRRFSNIRPVERVVWPRIEDAVRVSFRARSPDALRVSSQRRELHLGVCVANRQRLLFYPKVASVYRDHAVLRVGEDQDIHCRPALRRLVGDGRPHVAFVPLRALHPALRAHRVGVNRAARRRNVYVRVVRSRAPIEPRQRLNLRAQRRKRAARAVARSQKPALRADVLRKVGVVGVDVRVARRLIDALRRGDCEPPLIIAV